MVRAAIISPRGFRRPGYSRPGAARAQHHFDLPGPQCGRTIGPILADGDGRATELTAKPLFNFFCPELTGFVQPLAGELAAYRDLLCGVPFLTGYGVELGIMVDVLEEAGLGAMAQVDLGARQNRHQPLWDLSLMSSAVLRAMASRASLPQRGFRAPGTPGCGR